MATREEILGKIRNAQQQYPQSLPLPDPPQVWPVQGAAPDELLAQFEQSLAAVAGECRRCADRADAAAQIAEVLKSVETNAGVAGTETAFRWGVRSGELTEALADAVLPLLGERGAVRVTAPANPEDADPKELESISASLIPAEFLLADTGSAVVRSKSAFDRLMNYLSPVCLIAAKKSQLREHLPHAWPELLAQIASPGQASGEFLLMTGPSRTADIEKILILGVHGPKKVVVFVIENE
ncbi:MAG: LUD domain-containing protein [Thermoguttaceae bacterium]|nr:LUD domain-containing protein [Thermoguttaceae bacterium]